MTAELSPSMLQHVESLRSSLADSIDNMIIEYGEVTIDVKPGRLLECSLALRDSEEFAYEQLIDLCGVDYSQFGQDEWNTESSTDTGFSRGVDEASMGRLMFGDEMEAVANDKPRFASVMHLLSVTHNRRVRVRCFAENDDFPVVPSVIDVWSSADWYERESFDLYGILYNGHPDLRRILTDYGFVGHPFRKDFPLVGNVEMRYDPQQKRVIYEPVSIDPRVLVPRVKRDDFRYTEAPQEAAE